VGLLFERLEGRGDTAVIGWLGGFMECREAIIRDAMLCGMHWEELR
jgi:hypothetical protein